MSTKVSIGQAKRDISKLVNRIIYAGERIILTSRGKPKVALVAMDDYEQLLRSENRASDIQQWLTQARALTSQIKSRRGQPVDVETILHANRQDLENR